MRKLIHKFIVWYICRYYNACLKYDGRVIRVFSQSFYDDVVVDYLNSMARTRAKQKEETPPKFFTPEEVRKMTPTEVKANYKAIMNSMKEWK